MQLWTGHTELWTDHTGTWWEQKENLWEQEEEYHGKGTHRTEDRVHHPYAGAVRCRTDPIAAGSKCGSCEKQCEGNHPPGKGKDTDALREKCRESDLEKREARSRIRQQCR